MEQYQAPGGPERNANVFRRFGRFVLGIARSARGLITEHGERRQPFYAHHDLSADLAPPEQRTADLQPALPEHDRRDLAALYGSPYYSGYNLDEAIREAWRSQGQSPQQPE